MKTSQKGTKSLLTDDGEWMKHLRPVRRRFFWKGERVAQKNMIKIELKDE